MRDHEIVFAGGGKRLRITPRKVSQDDPVLYRSVTADIEIEARPFRGALGDPFYVWELVTFEKELTAFYDSLSGKALLVTSDGPLKLELTGNGQGKVWATVQVGAYHFVAGTQLSFSMELDQTFLPPVLKSLRELIEDCS